MSQAMNIDFPYRIARDGRSALTTDTDHVRDMIELVLFTQAGERVMRPDFGTGMLRFLYAANSPEIASALQLTVRAALSQFLGDVIDVGELTAESIDAKLQVTVTYSLRSTGEVRTDTFVRSAS